MSSGYKYWTPAIVREITNQSIPITFFGFTPTLRRSIVDLDEFFNKQGCIDPIDLRLVRKYRQSL